MAINANPGDPAANSLVTEAEAAAYMGMLQAAYSAPWFAASQADQDNALMQASMLLYNLPWVGSRANQTQTMCWPRRPAFTRNTGMTFGSSVGLMDHDGYPIDNLTIPQQVKNGCIEFAFRLISDDRTADAGALVPVNLKSGTTGISGLQRHPIPASALDLIAPFLKFDPRSNTGMVRA